MRRILAKIWSTALIISTFIMIAAFQNCGGKAVSTQQNQLGQNGDSISVNGTVQKSTLDGCDYVISAVDNTTGQVQQFIPQNMNPTLLVAGNQVSIIGTIATDTVNTCMDGTTIQVQEASLISN